LGERRKKSNLPFKIVKIKYSNMRVPGIKSGPINARAHALSALK
jgi:hypothetical protein